MVFRTTSMHFEHQSVARGKSSKTQTVRGRRGKRDGMSAVRKETRVSGGGQAAVDDGQLFLGDEERSAVERCDRASRRCETHKFVDQQRFWGHTPALPSLVIRLLSPPVNVRNAFDLLWQFAARNRGKIRNETAKRRSSRDGKSGGVDGSRAVNAGVCRGSRRACSQEFYGAVATRGEHTAARYAECLYNGRSREVRARAISRAGIAWCESGRRSGASRRSAARYACD